jgi:voltage-gated potassium channel
LVERTVTKEECGKSISELSSGGRGLRIYRNGEAMGFWEDGCQCLQPGDTVVEIVPTENGNSNGDSVESSD